MDQLKKHWILVVMGVVALAAVVLTFFPLGGMFEALRGDVSSSAGKFDALSSLRDKQRTLPVFDPAVDPEPLGYFPTDRAIEAGQAAVEEFEGASSQVLQAAEAANRRELLVPGTLPLERSAARRNILKQDFARAYEVRMNLDGNTFAASLVNDPLNGTFPVTPEEIDRQRVLVEQRVNRQRTYDGEGNEINAEAMDDELEAELKQIPKAIAFGKALDHQIYVERGAFEAYPGITRGDLDFTNEDIFWAQLRLWVQEIVAESVAAANEGSGSIPDSPVKHLLFLDVDERRLLTKETAVARDSGGGGDTFGGFPGAGFNPFAGGGFPGAPGGFPGAPGGGGGAPTQAEPEVEDAPGLEVDAATDIQPDFGVSVTGRVSNAFYDVIPVTLRLRVEADRLPEVIEAMSRDRLLTVRNLPVFEVVDAPAALAQGFVYGDAAVVEVEIDAEVLILRTWLQDYVPQAIQQQM